MNITIACRFPPVNRTPEQVWEDLVALTARLAAAAPGFKDWWANPRAPKDAYVSLADRAAFVSRLREDDDKLEQEYPGLPAAGGSGAVLTNAGNDKDWKARGGVALAYSPGIGSLRLDLNRIEKTYGRPEPLVWAQLAALTEDPRITFAQTEVQQLLDGELLLYSADRAVFPHREFLGWMGYVDRPLTTDQVPDAARLERHGEGTLVLATALLDLGDRAAIKQANQVEMSLADLGLLPVIDPQLG